MRKPYILFQTDFGIGGGGSLYGMCKLVDPSLKPYELSHSVPTFNTAVGTARLASVMPCWPEGTIFVSVVDPGVGTPRRACVARTSNGYYVVTPDNNTLTMVKTMFGIDEVREIDESINRYPKTQKVSIFHGRDLFAYCAARLASGIITYEQVGPAYPVDEIIMEEIENADNHLPGCMGEQFQIPSFGFGTTSPGMGSGLFKMTSGSGEKHGNDACIVIQSDFGHDGRVAMMHGICKSVCFDMGTYDLSHSIPTNDIVAASESLRRSVPFWPCGTVFVSTVGACSSARILSCTTSNGCVIVTPDNGTIANLVDDLGIAETSVIDCEAADIATPVSSLDYFKALAFCAARIA